MKMSGVPQADFEQCGFLSSRLGKILVSSEALKQRARDSPWRQRLKACRLQGTIVWGYV